LVKMWARTVFFLEAAYASLQLTSAVYDVVLASNSLVFPSSGDQLYATPSLQAYALLFWLQLHTVPSASTAVLTLTSEGTQAMTVSADFLHILGKVCDACSHCSTANLAYSFQPFKWTHIGISVDARINSVLVTATPWKSSTLHISMQSDFSIVSYDSRTSSVTVYGFPVSSR